MRFHNFCQSAFSYFLLNWAIYNAIRLPYRKPERKTLRSGQLFKYSQSFGHAAQVGQASLERRQIVLHALELE